MYLLPAKTPPHIDEFTNRVTCGDALATLQRMPSESVHCIVTSPPYFGLRDYGTATWEGGSAECDHIDSAYQGTRVSNSPKQKTSVGSFIIQYRDTCQKCGAKRIDNQIGLEETPRQYVEKLTALFREARRVLKADGTLWLNLGDSYGSSGGDTHSGFNARYSGTGLDGGKQARTSETFPKTKVNTGMVPKNLIGIPWRVAFALQDDNWILRSDIIWAKPNPMPESVTDRPTKSHEYVFLMSKNPRYWYDADAIREPAEYGYSEEHGAKIWDRAVNELKNVRTKSRTIPGDGGTRNKRSVWTIATQPTPEAHFATFPEKLIEPMILAGCPVGGIVLDPFFGSGTTGLVARRLGRKFAGIELNPAYVAISERRLSVPYTLPMFETLALEA